MDPNKYFSGNNLKNTGRKQKFGYAKNVLLIQEIVILSPVDFEKFVSDLLHAGSTFSGTLRWQPTPKMCRDTLLFRPRQLENHKR